MTRAQTKGFELQVRDQAGNPPIAIGERVNPCQPVVICHGRDELAARVCLEEPQHDFDHSSVRRIVVADNDVLPGD